MLQKDCVTPYPESEASLARTPGNQRPGPICLDQDHDSNEGLELDTCTDPERFPSMVKLASETIYTVEERQGLPSKEAQEIQHGPSDPPVPTQRHAYVSQSEAFADATKTFHGLMGPATARRRAQTQGLDQDQSQRRVREA